MQPTLVILAAGMASRYGSMKQVQGFGPGGETIMDYSIYDAIRAGFGKVVFVIRQEFAENFKKIFEPKLAGKISTAYVYQELEAFTDGYPFPAARSKPWGTAHALLCAGEATREPFAVINADDFYGADAFQKASLFLQQECKPDFLSIIGYELAKTLSAFGSVSRGVCEVDKSGWLISIHERTKILQKESRIIYEEQGQAFELQPKAPVSMNFWCFDPAVFGLTKSMFHAFLEKNSGDPKAEFFIPIVADNYITHKKGRIKVIATSSQWFGVTYKEDAPGVQKSIDGLIKQGEYPERLWP